jgi:hypothetical protein
MSRSSHPEPAGRNSDKSGKILAQRLASDVPRCDIESKFGIAAGLDLFEDVLPGRSPMV